MKAVADNACQCDCLANVGGTSSRSARPCAALSDINQVAVSVAADRSLPKNHLSFKATERLRVTCALTQSGVGGAVVCAPREHYANARRANARRLTIGGIHLLW